MPEPVTVGIVSTSWWGELMHVPAIQSHTAARLVACCGRNAERAQAFAAKHGIRSVYSDYKEMIEKEPLDLLVIATPEEAHHEICLAAADSGLHVVCEKPLAMNAAQASEMLAAMETSGAKHMTYFTWRWVPWLRYAKHLVDDGALGRIYEGRIRFAGGYGRSGRAHWKWDARTGTGILGDLGSHTIDLAHWLIGPIVDVDARLQSFISRPEMKKGADLACDSALMTVGFEEGAHACLEATAVDHLGALGMELTVALFGESGSVKVEADNANGWRCWVALADGKGEPVTPPDAMLEGIDKTADFNTQLGQLFTRQKVGTRLMIDSILDGGAVEPTFRAGYRAQAVMDAALKASEYAERVQVVTQ